VFRRHEAAFLLVTPPPPGVKCQSNSSAATAGKRWGEEPLQQKLHFSRASGAELENN